MTSTFIPAGPQPAVPTCDATAGAGQGGYTTPDGIVRNLNDANSYCAGQGLRLATHDELFALYDAYPDQQIKTVCGWDSGTYYWTSEFAIDGSAVVVNLLNGTHSTLPVDGKNGVTCVR
ncbi:hypothetical protein D3C80_1419580 [compost metagenome]